MTTFTIPHAAIIRSFFWPYSADDLAYGFSIIFKTRITAAQIKDIWIEESAWNPMLQVDRPREGFAQTENVRLRERLAA